MLTNIMTIKKPVRRALLLSGGAFLGSALMLSASAAFAADAGSLLNQQQQQQQPRLPDRLPSQEPTEQLPAAGQDQGTKVEVKNIHVTGSEGLAAQGELDALVAPYVGKSLTISQLQAVAGQVTSYLRSKGYPLAQAYLPKQDVTDGNIVIDIVRGHIEGRGATINGNGMRLSSSFAKSVADSALPKDGSTPDQADLERSVLLLNDLPGISARSTLERGTEPNSTQMLVDVTEGPWANGSLSVDNFGNRYTGGRRETGTASLNDPLGWGDQLSAQGILADRLSLEQLGYSLPLTSDGLRLSSSFTHMRYRIGEESENQDGHGTANTVDGKLSYPFLRTRQTSVYGGFGYTYKTLSDFTAGAETSNRRIHEVAPSLNATHFDQWGGGGLSTGTFTVTSGTMSRDRIASDEAADTTTARTSGKFSKANLSAARLQHLDSQFSLFVSASGQMADKNLDSSEKFILGGPSGIRAYPVGEGSGDDGWLTNAEVRYDVPYESEYGNLQLVTFFDAGGIRQDHNLWDNAINTATGRNYYTLSGAGVGFNLTKTNWYALRGSWAHSLGNNPGRSIKGNNSDGQQDSQQFWLQLSAYF